MQSNVKKCSKCGEVKPKIEFWKRPDRPGGLRSKCKACSTKSVNNWRRTNPDKVSSYRHYWECKNHEKRLAYRKGWWKRHGPEMIEYLNDHPEIKLARYAVRNAVRRGDLNRKPCEVCGNPKSQAHHEDYSRPLDVIWLCGPHHSRADMERRKREQMALTKAAA